MSTKVASFNKESFSIEDIISKYARKRLYEILREQIDGPVWTKIENKQIKKKNYTLLAESGNICFKADKDKGSFPFSFSAEDLKADRKGQFEIDSASPSGRVALSGGVWTQTGGENLLLRASWEDINAEIVFEPRQEYLAINGRVRSDTEKILRIGVELGVDALGWNWFEGIRGARRIAPGGQYYLLSKEYNLGKNGRIPHYSFGNISDGAVGIMMGVNPQEPRIFEITYDPQKKRYQLFFDVAISHKTKKFPNEATFSAFILGLEEVADFRAAVRRYYQIFPDAAKKRVEKEGNWMPFYDIASVSDADDFCFAFHELNVHYDGGLRSKADIAYNVSKGIYNFAYTEPWLYWVHMTREMERTYEQTLKLMEENLVSADEKTRDFASSGLLCAIKTPDGKDFIRFADTPWCCGAVLNTNTDPCIRSEKNRPVNRAATEFKQIIRSLEDSRFHGVYLDSMQSTELTHDYDEKHFETAEFPLTFEKDKKRPMICQFISAYHFTELLADYLHDKGKLLMGNFPAAYTFFMQHIDVPGEEIGWIENGQYKPMSHEELSARRALSYKRPYLFLQSVDFDQFNKDMVDKYMKRCLFYGMFPSMFSFNAQDAPYWENPAWYNRDRDLFQRYLPYIVNLSKAGWEAVTPVSADDENVLIEQFGRETATGLYITCCNNGQKARTAKINLSGFMLKKKTLKVKLPLSGKTYSVDAKEPYISLELEADEVVLLELT